MREFDVFLSHNSADKSQVEELAKRLREKGIEPWLDKWNLIPGDPWQEAIEEALDSCRTCAVFIGPNRQITINTPQRKRKSRVLISAGDTELHRERNSKKHRTHSSFVFSL